MELLGNLDFPVVVELRKRTPDRMYSADDIARYADYVQASIVGHIVEGHYTLEHANRMTVADLFSGNEGN